MPKTRPIKATGYLPIALLMSGLLHLLAAEEVNGLEVFRIGGAEPPAAGTGVVVHHIPWSDFDEEFGVDPEGLAAGILRPVYFGSDDDIAATSLARGGGPFVQTGHGRTSAITGESKFLVDGDLNTFYEWLEVSATVESRREFIQPHLISVDLGGFFLVNRVRVVTVAEHAYPAIFEVSANPTKTLSLGIGSFRSGTAFIDAESRFEGSVVSRVPENLEHVIDVSFAPVMAYSLDLLMHRRSPRLVQFSQVEVYGQGYINSATLVSPFIDLEEPAILGDIRWRGRQDPQAEVQIQTRAGKDLDPSKYWRATGRGSDITPFDEGGNLLDANAYRLLKPGEEAGITYDLDNWSFWSAPYDFADSSGTFILSPGPNSVFQIKADLLLSNTDGAEVDFVEFSVTKPPLAEEVVGEIFPTQVALGEVAQFTYAIEATIRSQHSGFDRIEISSPFGLAGVDTVKIGRVPVEATSQVLRPDSTLFAVQLPRRMGTADSGELVEVVFSAPVLRYGTPFTGWVRDAERPLDLAQRINPGDASDAMISESLVVRTSISDRLLHDLQVTPRLFSPNGDGANDAVEFSLNLLQVTSEVPVKLRIHELSGRLVWEAEQILPGSGRVRFTWPGRDRAGLIVAPGLYVYQLTARTEEGDERRTGSIAVSY